MAETGWKILYKIYNIQENVNTKTIVSPDIFIISLKKIINIKIMKSNQWVALTVKYVTTVLSLNLPWY